jgi:hypothetical protein
VSDVILGIGADDSEFQAVADRVEARTEEVGQKSQQMRNQVLADMRVAGRAISHVMQGMSLVTRILRLNLDPITRSLLSLITTTVSSMVSIATAVATTVVGIPASVIMYAAAMGLQFGVFIEVASEMENQKAFLDVVMQRNAAMAANINALVTGLTGLGAMGRSF